MIGIHKENLSLFRPAWTTNDLQAFNHLHLGNVISKNYFVKTKGLYFKSLKQLLKGSKNVNR